MNAFTDFFWPTLDEDSISDTENRRSRNMQDARTIETSTIKRELALTFLEEARRISAEEDDRKKTAETKATTYLVIVGALIPATVALLQSEMKKELGPLPALLGALTTLLPIAYLTMTSWWAVKAIKIKAFSRLDPMDLIKFSSDDDAIGKIAKEIIKSARSNRDILNSLVTCVKMTQEFMIRSLAALAIFVFIRVGFSIINTQQTNNDSQSSTQTQQKH